MQLFWVQNTHEVCMGTTYYSLGRKLHQRTSPTAKIVVSANGETLFGRRSRHSLRTRKMEDTSKTALFPHNLSQGVEMPHLFSYIAYSPWVCHVSVRIRAHWRQNDHFYCTASGSRRNEIRHLFFSAFFQYTVCLCVITRDGVCSRSCISRSCCWWPDTFCYSVMARKKQPAWERTSSTSKEWLDTVGGVCHPVWKRATLVYPANAERSEFSGRCFLAGRGFAAVWGSCTVVW